MLIRSLTITRAYIFSHNSNGNYNCRDKRRDYLSHRCNHNHHFTHNHHSATTHYFTHNCVLCLYHNDYFNHNQRFNRNYHFNHNHHSMGQSARNI